MGKWKQLKREIANEIRMLIFVAMETPFGYSEPIKEIDATVRDEAFDKIPSFPNGGLVSGPVIDVRDTERKEKEEVLVSISQFERAYNSTLEREEKPIKIRQAHKKLASKRKAKEDGKIIRK